MDCPDPGRVIASLATPFTEEESIDYDRLAALADWVVSTERADSVIVTDETGEGHSLSDDERLQVWTEVVETIGDRATVIAGAGCTTTRGTIRLAKAAELVDVDMVLISYPSWQDPTQDTVYRYYTSVADASGLPIMIHNPPAGGMAVETLRRFMDTEQIVAVKDDRRDDPMQNLQYLTSTRSRGDFRVYAGYDIMALPAVAQGAAGVALPGVLLIGNLMKQMTDALLEHRLHDAAALNERMLPVYDALIGHGRTSPAPGIKRGLELLGQPAGAPREPLLPFSSSETVTLRKALVKTGLISF